MATTSCLAACRPWNRTRRRTNDVSGEATYHLFTPHVGMGPPIRHVGNDQPYCLYFPITPLPSSTAEKRGGNNDNSKNNKNNKNNNSNDKNNNNAKNKNNNDDDDDDDDDDDGGSHDAARSGGKNKAPKSKKGNDGGGSWEEKYHPVTGAKSWYHTRTKKSTTKDPFF